MKSFETRFLTFGGATLQLEYAGGRPAEIVEFLFKRIPRGTGAAAPHGRLCLSEETNDGVLTLSSRGEVCCVDRSPGAIASWLLHVTCRQLAGGGTNGLLLHAAAVTWNGRSLLVPGATGSGKSTLTAFLTTKGFDYLTDELAYVPASSTCVEGFTAPLKIKKTGLDALNGYVPLSSSALSSMVGSGDILLDFDGPRAYVAVPLSIIIFPRYQPRSRFRLRPLSPAQAGLRLMAGVLNAEALPDHGFRETARVATLAAGYEMRYANLGQVEAHLELLRHMTSVSGLDRESDVRVKRRAPVVGRA